VKSERPSVVQAAAITVTAFHLCSRVHVTHVSISCGWHDPMICNHHRIFIYSDDVQFLGDMREQGRHRENKYVFA